MQLDTACKGRRRNKGSGGGRETRQGKEREKSRENIRVMRKKSEGVSDGACGRTAGRRALTW